MAGAESARVSGEERAELARALPAYEIGAELGRGTFAAVFAARHVRLGREVAIKRLSPRLLTNAAARDRFATEARLLASTSPRWRSRIARRARTPTRTTCTRPRRSRA
jgi:serine/threonine protein kinase